MCCTLWSRADRAELRRELAKFCPTCASGDGARRASRSAASVCPMGERWPGAGIFGGSVRFRRGSSVFWYLAWA